MINALREVPIKCEVIGRRQGSLLCSVGICTGTGGTSRIWVLGSKGKEIAAEKMAGQRFWPKKRGMHLGDFR